ncbi:MAG: class I SAM-dependent methyltransferase [Candidatus Paceibacterota bacterium]|jgi:2-polyprenyl-3-methyl-5-hydroxy-6-metoxy-1,4-benzoquinol methylase
MEHRNNTREHRDIWQNIWLHKNRLSYFVDYGRFVYNGFFRKMLRKHINGQTEFLELGCGTSTLTISLAKEMKGLVGLDISPEALKISQDCAKKYGVTNAKFIDGNCLDVPFQGTFDIVWSQGLMEHFDNPLLVAEQHWKATKLGGTTLISVPYKWSYLTPWYTITRPKIFRSLWPWTDQTFFSKKELIKIGKKITPSARVYLLRPFFLGIVILELKKPIS